MLQTAIDPAPIRDIIVKHGRLPVDASTLQNDTNLYNVGLTSLATVSIMLALEDHFQVEFPDRLLTRKTFESVDAIAEAVAKLVP